MSDRDSAEAKATKELQTKVNEELTSYLYYIFTGVSVLLIAWRLSTYLTRYVRTVVCLKNDTQVYFARASQRVSFFKRNILYAPILGKRHNREFQLSSAVNVGTLPTRLQLVFIAGYFASNIAFSIVDLPWAETYDDAARAFRNRTGVLSVVNMVG